MYKKPYKPKAKKGVSASRVKKIVKKEVYKHVEVKRRDEIISLSPAIGAGASFQLINPTANNLLDFGRIGNTITMLSVQIRGDITFPDSTNKARFMIVYDRQPNGAVPLQADFLTFTTNAVNSFVNPDSRKRFHIVYDRAFAGGVNGPVAKALNFYRKLNLKTIYSGTTDTITDIRTGALWAVCMSDSLAPGNPQLTCACRVRYTDA